MSEKYTGQADDKRHTSDTVDIRYSPKRCIHAAECVDRLAVVFDVEKRPWIQPVNGSANTIVDVVANCPSGALHTERKDGGNEEPIPSENVVVVHPDSYYQFSGNIEIEGSEVAIEKEVRATLCRCGLSQNKPFCDNSHKNKFQAPAAMVDMDGGKPTESGGTLKVTVHENGPIELNGNFELRDESGNTIYQGTKTWLCRCGQSSKKPFCDGTHKKVEFSAP